MFTKFAFVFFFILNRNAYAYIDPGFLSSIAMYIFMIFNFLVLILFVYPKEFIKKIFNKIFKKNDKDNKKNK
jgi:hypothetical protein